MMARRSFAGVLAAAFVTVAIVFASPAAASRAGSDGDPGSSLEIYHSPPILVRMGERVRIPVDVVCLGVKGHVCSPKVTFRLKDRFGYVRETTSTAASGLEFDLSGAAARGSVRSPSGSIAYSIRAQDPGGGTVGLPDRWGRRFLRFYVARELRAVRVPAATFGEVRTGKTVLFLPWGSGPNRAGLSPGNEALTLGPSSFDLDSRGRIYLLDPLQRRLAIFSKGSLVRQVTLPIGPAAQIATEPGGTAHVVDSSGAGVTVRRIDLSGRVGAPLRVGDGIPAGIDATRTGPVVNVLPAETWVQVRERQRAEPAAPTAPTVGKPLPSGAQLLRVATERFVRLATLRDKGVTSAVELRSKQRFGEVAIAETDGRGGYWTVVRVWRERPSPADQYEVVHVSSRHGVTSFGVADETFSEVSATAKFRLGDDGDALYQMTTRADGLRIERYDLGGRRR